MIESVDRALAAASNTSNCTIKEYSGAPVFMDNKKTGSHEWLIEFEREPEDLNLFKVEFDKTLQTLNSDYEAKRTNDYIISFPKFTILPSGTFYAWLDNKGKLGGQNKIPRLMNDRKILDDIKAFHNTTR